MAKKHLAAMLLALVALTSACGRSGSNTSVGRGTTTSTMVAVDYAKQYLDIEAPFLERGAAANAALQAAARDRDIPNLVGALHDVGSINWEFATALLAQKWPDDVRSAIQKQAKLLGDLSGWQRIATTADWTSTVASIQGFSAEVVDAIRATRELLGLPPSESPESVLPA